VTTAVNSATVNKTKQQEFAQLFAEFARNYPQTAEGQSHSARYARARQQAQENYARLAALAARGGDITDAVLLQLLPHTDTANHRWQGAWIHWAPTIVGDIKSWYEAAGWTQPSEWPAIAQAIFHFVQRCVDAPDQLVEACREFSALSHTKGFQSGTLSPILNALRPAQFALVNNTSRSVLNYFTDANHGGPLRAYPSVNAALHRFARDVEPLLQEQPVPGLAPADALDMFAHWLVAVKKFTFRQTRYWAVALSHEPGQWYEFWQGNFVGLGRDGPGWEELGDLTGVSRREFVERRDSLVAQHDAWSKRETEQVWRFARRIGEGDRIVVHQDGARLLGVGVVEGGYYFVPGVPAGHRYPVTWEQTTPRVIDPGWRRALQEIDAATLESLLQAPTATDAAELPGRNGTVQPAAADLPQYVRFVAPILQVLQELGGAGRAGEVTARVLAREQLDVESPSARQQVRRARDVLQEAGLLTSQPRGQWALTDAGRVSSSAADDGAAVYREAQYRRRTRRTEASEPETATRLAETRAPYEVNHHATRQEPVPEAVRETFARQPPYTLAQCAAATGLAEAELARWVRAIERKGQAIFYGPPGTGKTFLAEQLARHLVSESDGFVDMVQFHPSYAYEDFVQGLRPQTDPQGNVSYPLVPGRFLEFCARARRRDGRCVLIIDEINRANLSRVFGELMYLLEYRERAVVLAGGGEPFHIPGNVRILGTMNTADRSIALVDHALRRRFAFVRLQPDYDVLRHFHQRHATDFPVEPLIGVLQRLNRQIGDPHYAVGVSFFLDEQLDAHLEEIWRLEIQPYLEELFFDQPERLEEFRWARLQRELQR
jgi:MoxR-like ATPase